MSTAPISRNFGFLELIDADLYREIAHAELAYAQIHAYDLAAAGLRRFCELLTSRVLGAMGQVEAHPEESFRDRIRRMVEVARPPRHVEQWFHQARMLGNRGSHVERTGCSSQEVLKGFADARRMCIWWLGECLPYEDVRVPGFVPPTTGNAALDSRNQAELDAEERRRATMSEADAEAAARKAAQPTLHRAGALSAAWERLDEGARAALTAALDALREDPETERWPREAIAGASDDKLREVKVSAALSMVLAIPARGDVVFVLWACPPGEVAGWTAGKRVEVHPALGSVQVFDVDDAEAAVRDGEGAGGSALFATWDDEELVRIGVPRPLLPAVRAVADESGLARLAPHVPGEMVEALTLLGAAESIDEVVAVLGLGRGAEAEPVDVDDFERAAVNPTTQRSFRMLTEDEDLEAALDGSVEAWRVFLHPDQRALVTRHANGPVRVLGGAGTGKTVALLHRAAHLLREVVVEGEVLVTTFTRNLALDLEHNLGLLVEPAELKRTTVWNLHRLARRIAEGGDYDDTTLLDGNDADAVWEAAYVFESLGLPLTFYTSEWRDVVQAQDVRDEHRYLRVPRRGRGNVLGRAQRRAVWSVFEAFRRLKAERKRVEWPDLVQHATDRIRSGAWRSPFKAVLADEVQDFSAADLRLLRALVPEGPNDMFLVGDAHQRIYGTPTSMRQCGIEIRGRARRLRVNYRTTEEIREWAARLLHDLSFDDLDGGTDTLRGYRSLRSGLRPALVETPTQAREDAAILETVARWKEHYPAESICVSSRSRELVKHYVRLLEEAGHAVLVLKGEKPTGEGVRVATMHRMKGLEFPCVLLAGVREGVVPAEPYGALDTEGLADHALRERAVLYVAATRARDELVVTAGGRPSEFLG